MSSTNNNIEAVANQMPTGGSGEFNPKPAGVGRENHDGVSSHNQTLSLIKPPI